MHLSRFFAIAALVCTIGLSGCSLPGKSGPASASTVAEAAFSESDTFSRTYGSSPELSCEAARRALLSQAYLMTEVTATRMSARKNFQQSREQHYEVEFHITCVPNPGHSSTIFVSAVQQLYSIRKTSSSASVGVGILGSFSVPVMSEDESMIKIGSVTLTKPDLYQRFFDLVENHLVAMRTSPEPQADSTGAFAAPQSTKAASVPIAAPVSAEHIPVLPSVVVDPLNPGAPALAGEMDLGKETPAPTPTDSRIE